MAWNGGGFSDEEDGRGLELSLGLPGYFSAVLDQQDGKKGGSAAGAKGTSGGFKKARPTAPAPVVGWPPVRAFRRNLGASASKPSSSQWRQYAAAAGANKVEASGIDKGLFVKVNMDGVPIGRKVDLAAHGSYDRLSAAVGQLFRGLLAAQTSGGEQKVSTGPLVSGSGEYTLVYEDDDGDQMLVGDVPWDMFVATAKRLRVFRSSDLTASSVRAGCRTRPAVER